MIAGVIAGGRPYSASGAPAIPTTGLVAWYKMDSIAGGVLIDEMGSYSGTVSGCSVVAGRFGSALKFNGTTSDGVLLPAMHLSEITISAWIYVDSLAPVQQPIIGNWNAGATTSYLIDIYSSSLRWIVEKPPTLIINKAASAGAWMHVCTYSSISGNAGIVVDGVTTESAAAFALKSPSEAITLGYKGDNPSPRFGGKIDSVRIYNRKLSPSEIAALYSEV